MYGYVTGATDIIWRFENQGELESDSVYSITEMNGDRLLQNGGDSPIPSVKSVLTIERPTSSQAGTYLCVGAGLTGIVSLDIGRSEFMLWYAGTRMLYVKYVRT